MVTSDGYTLFQKGNQIIIDLPQTWVTLTNSTSPIVDRKPHLSTEQEMCLLAIVKEFMRGEQEMKMEIPIPVKVYFGDIQGIIDEIQRLQTYKLFEGDDMVLVDFDAVVAIMANHIKADNSSESPNGWIPCSERLPDGVYPVIVTWKNTDPKSYYQYILGKHYVGVAHYKNGKWYWYSSVTEDVLMEYGRYDSEEFDEAIECMAWMPLPEPWKEEE